MYSFFQIQLKQDSIIMGYVENINGKKTQTQNT